MYALESRNDPVHFKGIKEAAAACLLKSRYHSVTRIFCDYHHGILFLRGRLPRFHEKQVAQEAVARVKGVTHVINEIEVD